MKRNLIRGGIAAAWVLLGILLFITSRGHTLLLDNRDVPGLEAVSSSPIRAPEQLTVLVDAGNGVELFRGDRDLLTVTGSKHRVRVEFTDGREPFEGNFVLPIKNDMYLLSVPRMISGIEPFVEIFKTAPEPRTDDSSETAEAE